MPRWFNWFLAGALCAIVAAFFWPWVGGDPSSKSYKAACQSNLKQIGLAISQYSADYDGRLPLVVMEDVNFSTLSTGYSPYGWVSALLPYHNAGSKSLYQCPSDKQTHSKQYNFMSTSFQDIVQTGFTDYWYNGNVSGVAFKSIKFPATTLWCGDGNDGTELTNARYSLKELPQAWRTSEESPAQRHLGGANYLFADGHVKAVKPQRIKNTRAEADEYSFAVK